MELPTSKVPLTHIVLAFIVIYDNVSDKTNPPSIIKLLNYGGSISRITLYLYGTITFSPCKGKIPPGQMEVFDQFAV